MYTPELESGDCPFCIIVLLYGGASGQIFYHYSRKCDLRYILRNAWHLVLAHRLTVLTHWGRVTHICVSKLTIIGSDNGLAPGGRQAINWTNAGIMLIRPLGTNFNWMLIEILSLKVSSAKWRPFCLGLNVLRRILWEQHIWKQPPS